MRDIVDGWISYHIQFPIAFPGTGLQNYLHHNTKKQNVINQDNKMVKKKKEGQKTMTITNLEDKIDILSSKVKKCKNLIQILERKLVLIEEMSVTPTPTVRPGTNWKPEIFKCSVCNKDFKEKSILK